MCLSDTSRVVHVQEEHILIPIQDGVKLQIQAHIKGETSYGWENLKKKERERIKEKK